MDVTLRLISGTRDAAEMIHFRQSKWKSNSKWKWKWEMENEQFSAVFKWFFLLAKQQTKAAMSLMAWEGEERLYYEGSFQSFWLAVAQKKNEFNWIDFECGTVCRLSTAPLKSACVWGRRKGGRCQAGWLQFYKASVWPRLALIDFCVDICALGYRARAAALCLFGDLCCPARGLPPPITHSTEDWGLRTVCCRCCVCDATINALCCH